MAGWSKHTGLAVALPLENVDTDQLIPARFMSTPRSEGYGRFLLNDLRRESDGAPIADMPLERHP
ncbi:MAG: 3-isopropylmalate dehydratase small subunit, partial [Thalassovita sp.]|nr:3-isopropylmalate dehydratase small subunit [Thalassovita sp.]